MDPVGKGMSEVLEATVQHVRTTKKEVRRLMKTLPLDPFQMDNGYTVLSAELSKQLDKQERVYQKVFLHAIPQLQLFSHNGLEHRWWSTA